VEAALEAHIGRVNYEVYTRRVWQVERAIRFLRVIGTKPSTVRPLGDLTVIAIPASHQ
jgi:hypothetical protein